MTGGTVDVEVIDELKESDSAEKVVLLSADSLAKKSIRFAYLQSAGASGGLGI
jgi:hypothetical protein